MQAPATAQRGGAADIVYVVCLMQAAFVLLAGLGEMLLMAGNPLYLALPLVKMAVLFVFAAKVVSGRRWAMIAVIVVQGITLVGFWLQVGVGLLPGLDFTLNLVGLITNVGMPATVIFLCASMLARRRAVPPTFPFSMAYGPAALMAYGLPAPQDPYAPAPLVTSATVPEVVVSHVVVPTAVLPRGPR
jgi:hypothetical protein